MKKRIVSLFLAVMMMAASMNAPVMASDIKDVQEQWMQEDIETNGEESVWEDSGEGNGSTNGESFPVEQENDLGLKAEEIEEGEEEVLTEPEPAETQTVPDQKQEDEPVQPEAGETEVFQEFDFTVLDAESAENLTGDSPEAQEVVEEIGNGDMIAVAPVALEGFAARSVQSEEIMTMADTDSYIVKIGARIYCDEVWTEENHAKSGSSFRSNYTIRTIEYSDSDGVRRTAPLYCMNAMKLGYDSEITLKDAAVTFMANSNLQKILYFGYGGPGDACGTFDPTCSHIDWGNVNNRIIFTHIALSKLYNGDTGNATETELEHVGLNTFISTLTSKTIPDHSDVKFYGKNSSGDTVSAKDMTGNLTYWRVIPDSLSWLESSMQDGVQISDIYRITAGLAANGITITRGTGDVWQLAYWTSADDYAERGRENPRLLAKGSSVTLKAGARFRFAFPQSITTQQQFTFQAYLRPVKFVLVDGSAQTGSSGMQDFGAYVYQGAREQLTLKLNPAPSGDVLLIKVADHDPEERIEGAGYRLIAAEDIVSNGVTVLAAGKRMAGANTDADGKILFSNIPVGKYYLVEVGRKVGTESEKYLLDVTTYNVNVAANESKTITVKEIPDMYGRVSVRKVIAGTELNLEGAVFTVYSWSESSGKYTNGVNLTYNPDTKRYESETLRYTADNKGKFVVKETKNPSGFTGTFRKTFQLQKLGQEELFEFTAENEAAPRRVEIIKLDSATKEVLPDAEFTIYEWNQIKQKYEDIGELLTFDEEDGKYYSQELNITDLNAGRYKVEETRIPEGYTGTFVRELNLYEDDEELQFTVENDPVIPIKGRIKIKKTDSLTGAILEDAEFTIYPYNVLTGKYENTLGEKAKVSFDEESGLYLSKELEINSGNAGRFKVTETKSPEGYTGFWQKEFVLTEETPEPEIFEVTNNPDRPPVGEITVIKKIKENEILWAHGNPVFTFVAEGTDIMGNSRKYENYICFSKDGYTVDEQGYAVLQITFRNVPVGQYQVYEKPVLYYYLESAGANTSNVSIVKKASPAYGLTPKEIAYGNIALTAADNQASITFVNKKARYDRYVHNDAVKNSVSISFKNLQP